MKDKVKAGYDKAAKEYEAGRDQYENDQYLEKISQLLKPNSKVLDVGCGSGVPVASFLVEQGHSVLGVDISEEQIKLARKNVPKGEFEVRDMSELKKGELEVDAIVSFYAIFHIPREEHEELFAKFNSFLPEGGLILVTMGADEWEGVNKDFFGAEMHWSHYGADKNTEIVQNAGFELLINEIDDTGGEQHQVILAKKTKGS